MEKRVFRNRLVTVLIITAMALSLTGCRDGQASEGKKQVSVYLWSSAMLAEYAEYVQSQLPDLEIEFAVGNNDLDYYTFMAQNDALPDIITNRRFSLRDAAELQNQLMDLSNTDTAAS